jgi:protein lifeguard
MLRAKLAGGAPAPDSEAPKADEHSAEVEDEFTVGPNLSTKIRHEFVSKVFSLVAIMVFVTAAGCISATYLASTHQYTAALLAAYPVLLGLGITAMIAYLLCIFCTNMRNTPTGGYILMAICTISETSLLSGVGILFGADDFADVVYLAFGAAFFLTLGLIAFAMQTKYDVTGMGMWISAGFGCMLIVGCVQGLLSYKGFEFKWFNTAVGIGALLLVSFSMVREVQLIVGGENHHFKYSVDDYAIAATQVYLSIVYMVIRIMELLAALRAGRLRAN